MNSGHKKPINLSRWKVINGRASSTASALANYTRRAVAVTEDMEIPVGFKLYRYPLEAKYFLNGKERKLFNHLDDVK